MFCDSYAAHKTHIKRDAQDFSLRIIWHLLSVN